MNAREIWQTRDEMIKITNMLDHLTKKVACQGEALETKTEEVAWLQEKVAGGTQLFEGAHLTGGNMRFCRESSKCHNLRAL